VVIPVVGSVTVVDTLETHTTIQNLSNSTTTTLKQRDFPFRYLYKQRQTRQFANDTIGSIRQTTACVTAPSGSTVSTVVTLSANSSSMQIAFSPDLVSTTLAPSPPSRERNSMTRLTVFR